VCLFFVRESNQINATVRWTVARPRLDGADTVIKPAALPCETTEKQGLPLILIPVMSPPGHLLFQIAAHGIDSNFLIPNEFFSFFWFFLEICCSMWYYSNDCNRMPSIEYI